MTWTFNAIAIQIAVAQRAVIMRAEIVNREELSIDITDGDPDVVLGFKYPDFTRGDILYLADGDVLLFRQWPVPWWREMEEKMGQRSIHVELQTGCVRHAAWIPGWVDH